LNNLEIRALARKQLKGNWLNPILASLSALGVAIVALIGLAITPLAYIAILIGCMPPIAFGIIMFYLNFVRGNNPAPTDVTKGFESWGKSIIALLLVGLYTALWSMLFYIPGIVKSFSYSMTLYILNDNPDMTASEAIFQSQKMMFGHKSQLFWLSLSFIGWYILASFTLGIGFIWLIPYMGISVTNFYESLKQEQV